MPSVSKRQQKFFGAELSRKRAGKKTRTGMSEKQMKEYASTKHKGMPEKKQDHSEENTKERMKMMGMMPEKEMMMKKKEMEKKHKKMSKKMR